MADLPLRQKVAETRFFSVKNGNFATSLLFSGKCRRLRKVSFSVAAINKKADTPKNESLKNATHRILRSIE